MVENNKKFEIKTTGQGLNLGNLLHFNLIKAWAGEPFYDYFLTKIVKGLQKTSVHSCKLSLLISTTKHKIES